MTILSEPNPAIGKLIVPLVLVLLFDYLPGPLNYIRASFEEYNDRKVRFRFEQEIIQKQHDLDIATIEQPEFQDMLYQVRSRGESAMTSILWWFFALIRDSISVIIALVIIATYTKIGLGIILIATVPIYFYESWRGRRLAKIWTSRSEANRKAGMKVAIFGNKESVLEIKFFDVAKFFKLKIKNIRDEISTLLTKDDIETAPIYAGVNLFPSIGIGATILIVLRDVISGVRPLGSISFVWGSIWKFSGSLQTILRSVGRLSEQKIHASKLINLLEIKPYIHEKENGLLAPDSFTLEFKNVSFKYPNSERTILEKINCKFNFGQEVAIVGLNGAGKTTLLRLITRVYDPTAGEILLDGVSLKEYSLKSYREKLAVMMQDYTTYSDETIQDNITTQKIFDEKLFNSVVNHTGVAEYTKNFEKGFNQMIGTEFRGGVEFSKGQKQKLALARVLYRNAPIIILDEPTAAIDALSEDTIFKNLRDHHKHQIRIIISHKFSNVRDADKIILIEHGKIIEQGSHDELMSIENGKYRELFNLQAEGYQDKPKKKITGKPRKKKIVVDNSEEYRLEQVVTENEIEATKKAEE